jgi:hypothetical protein
MSKGGLWFTEEPTQEDIENRWNSCIRRYKTNKNLIRTNIERKINSLDLKIWDNDENKLEEKDITLDDDIIAIFQITGLKFSSTSFQIDLSLKQIMKFKNKEIFSKCLIKVNNNIIEKNDIKIKNNEIKKNNNNEKECDEYSYDDNRDDNSEDDNSEDDNSEDDNSEDDNSEDDNSEDDNSEDDNNDEENNDESKKKIEKNLKKENNSIENENNSIENENNSIEDENNSIENENNSIENENNSIENENNSMEDKNNIKNKKKETDLLEGNLKNDIKDDSLEKNILEEVTLEISDNVDIIKLKNPKDVYLDIYNKALIKARKAKKDAIHAYLEAKKIKKTYLLDDIESSDGEDLDNFSD